MPDIQSIIDKFLHYDGTRKYTKSDGYIDYLDGGRLARPASMSRPQQIFTGIVVAIGVVIGGIILYNTIISQWQESVMYEQAIAENLSREASIESIPHMASLINMTDDEIKNSFNEAGYSIYDASKMDDSNDMTLYRIPSDMTPSEATSMFLRGISSLNASEATKLLNGSWVFSTDRVNTTSMVVRYADFSTKDPQIAVQNALLKQGFESTSVSDSGIDESDNTYSAGTIEAEGAHCTWKISAVKLSDIYSITGLPEDACYVGVRITIV